MKKGVLMLCFLIPFLWASAQKTKFEWAKRTGGINYDNGLKAMAVDSNGNVFTTGCFDETFDFDPDSLKVFNLKAPGSIYISKINSQGNFVWAKNMGGGDIACGSSLSLDASGNIYISGVFRGTADFDPGPGIFNLITTTIDMFILKLDSSANFLWVKRINGGRTYGAMMNSIKADVLGNIYTAGYFSDTADFDPTPTVDFNLISEGGRNAFVLKLDGDGNMLWAKQFTDTLNSVATSISIDLLGNVYTTGNFYGTADFDPSVGVFNLKASGNNNETFISKLDASGNFVWAKHIGGDGYGVYGKSIVVDKSNVYTTGYFKGTADFDPSIDTFNLITSKRTFAEMFVLKLDIDGNFRWAKQIGSDINGINGNSIAIDKTGVYTTGYFKGTADFDPGPKIFNLTSFGQQDLFISKLDVDGNFLWAKGMGGTEWDEGLFIGLDAIGNVYTTGVFSDTVDFDPDILGSHFLYSAGFNDIFVHKMSIKSASINEYSTFNREAIYPNPTNGILNITLKELNTKKIRIQVYSSTGKLLNDEISNNLHPTLNIQHLPSGLYFVRIITDNKNIACQKIIKH